MKRARCLIVLVFLAIAMSLPVNSSAAQPAVPVQSALQQVAEAEKEFRKNIFRSEVKLIASRMVRGYLWQNGIGTGVIVGRESRGDKTVFYIISAAHVLLTDQSELLKDTMVIAAFPEKGIMFPVKQSGYQAKFLFGVWEFEYVFLEAEVSNADLDKLDIAVAPIAQGAPERLESFWVSGYLKGQLPVVNRAYLSAAVVNDRGVAANIPYFILANFYFITDGANGPGMSGGGVFNAKGELVALIWAVNGEHIVNAVPASLIEQNFLANLEALKNASKEKPKPAPENKSDDKEKK